MQLCLGTLAWRQADESRSEPRRTSCFGSLLQPVCKRIEHPGNVPHFEIVAVQQRFRVFLPAALPKTETLRYGRQDSVRQHVRLAITAEMQFIPQPLKELIRLASSHPFGCRHLVLLQNLLDPLTWIEGLRNPPDEVEVAQTALGLLDVRFLNECCPALAQMAFLDAAEHFVDDGLSTAFD